MRRGLRFTAQSARKPTTRKGNHSTLRRQKYLIFLFVNCQDLIFRLESAELRQQPTVREETISPKRRLKTLQTLLAFYKIKLFCFIQSPTKSNWRKKREEFISSLRAAKKAQKFLSEGGNIRDLPPPPPSDTSDYIQCQYCQRRFSPHVADRHIPKCKNIESNKTGRNKSRK